MGMEAKVGDAVKGSGLHVPSVCKFVNEKFRRPWPERLTDVVAYADDLHDALLESGAKFCDRVVREVLLDAVERVVVWKTWEIKHARRDILDRNSDFARLTALASTAMVCSSCVVFSRNIANRCSRGMAPVLWDSVGITTGREKSSGFAAPSRRPMV